MTKAEEIEQEYNNRMARLEQQKEERLERMLAKRGKLKVKARARLDKYHLKKVRFLTEMLKEYPVVFCLRRATMMLMRDMGFSVGTGTNYLGRKGYAVAHPNFNWEADPRSENDEG